MRTWERLVDEQVGSKGHRLYGGSQYHRTVREFNLASRCLRLPTISEDEIANAAGVGDTHDGVNFLRASCVIALEKARTSFDPLLEAFSNRMVHVMQRLYPVSEYMLRQRNERQATSYSLEEGKDSGAATDITQNPQFRQLVRTIFERFIEQCSESTMRRCRDDLTALTRFVTWDLHERSSGALRKTVWWDCVRDSCLWISGGAASAAICTGCRGAGPSSPRGRPRKDSCQSMTIYVGRHLILINRGHRGAAGPRVSSQQRMDR